MNEHAFAVPASQHAATASQTGNLPSGAQKSVFCFAVHAAAEPDVMPRVLELFSKRNLVPASWHSSVTGAPNGQDELQIDIQVQQLETGIAEHIARCLRQIVHVNTVMTSEKGYSNSALGA